MQSDLFKSWPDYMGRVRGHPLRSVHIGMVQRCHYSLHRSFPDYGGRGVTVDPLFRPARSFIGWALQNGYKPGLQLDRKDNDGPYSPDNCRFVTRLKNCQNKRNSIFAISGASSAELQRGWNISSALSFNRRKRGYPVELAATLPPGVYLNEIERLAADGQFQTILGLLVGPYLKETK